MIQENVSWNTHVKHICSKISKATALLAKLKHYMPKYILSIIYNSLCISHMSYALSVWGAAPSAVTDRITKLQKKVFDTFVIRNIMHTLYPYSNGTKSSNSMIYLNSIAQKSCTKKCNTDYIVTILTC